MSINEGNVKGALGGLNVKFLKRFFSQKFLLMPLKLKEIKMQKLYEKFFSWKIICS